MRTFSHLWQYFTEFFLEWEMFHAKVVENIKTHILCSVTVFRISCRIWDNVEKYCGAREPTDNNIIQRIRFACWVSRSARSHAHAKAPANPYRRMHGHTRTQKNAKTRPNITSYVYCLSCLKIIIILDDQQDYRMYCGARFRIPSHSITNYAVQKHNSALFTVCHFFAHLRVRVDCSSLQQKLIQSRLVKTTVSFVPLIK